MDEFSSQDSSYDSRKNGLIKISILKLFGHGLKNSYEDEESVLLRNAINNQIDSMHHLTILEKEKLRLNLMKKSSLHDDYYVKKYFKYINKGDRILKIANPIFTIENAY